MRTKLHFFLLLSSLLFISFQSFAKDSITCYNTYKIVDGKKVFSRTPERICITYHLEPSAKPQASNVTISLRTGMPFDQNEKEVAKFNYQLLSKERGYASYTEVYGVANPQNSIYNSTLQIKLETSARAMICEPSSHRGILPGGCYHHDNDDEAPAMSITIGDNVFLVEPETK